MSCCQFSKKPPNEALDSPFSVSSEESLGFFNGFDHKCNGEIEGADLTALFDEAVTLPLKLPSELPKDLLSFVIDCGIILV